MRIITPHYFDTVDEQTYKYLQDVFYNLLETTKARNPDDTGSGGDYLCWRWFCSFRDFVNDMKAPPTLNSQLTRLDDSKDWQPDNTVWSASSNE